MIPSQAKNAQSSTGAAGSDETQERPQNDHSEAREHHLDKTIEDSFPASDPPSTDPNPGGEE